MNGPGSILVKLDGSAYSHVAADLSVQWAKEFGSRLFGISVVNDSAILAPHPDEPPSVSEQRRELLQQARECAERYLEQFEARCREQGVAVETCCEKGRAADEILREVQRHDLVVLGREVHFHRSLALSSSLSDMLRHSSRPIVAVPLSLPQRQAVLVAYDGQSPASRALAALLQCGLATSRDIHVVCVRKSHGDAVADASLAMDYLKSRGFTATAHAIDSRSAPDRIIMPLIAELDVGLLVTGAYGRSRTAEILFGSTTKQILKESPVPVFMFH